MGLSDYDQDVKESEGEMTLDEVNEMPPGEYELSIVSANVKNDCITIRMVVTTEGENFGREGMTWFNFSKGKVQFTAARLKSFVRAVGAPDALPSMFEDNDFREFVKGRAIKATLEAREYQGKVFKDWKGWTAIEQVENAEPEINLDESPF